MENQNIYEYETEMATLDLKGKRYRDAIEKFSELARLTNSTFSWIGLGIAKFGLITEDVTVLEVFHCFSKAKSTSDEKPKIDILTLEASKEIISELYKTYVKAVLKERKVKAEGIKQLIASIGILAMSGPPSKANDKLSYMMGVGLSAMNFMGYIDSKESAESLREAIKVIEELISEITEQALEFYSDDSDESELKEFKKFLFESKKEATALCRTEKEIEVANEKIKSEQEKKILLEQAQPILEDSSHMFHSAKKKALDAYQNMDYEVALKHIKQANQFVKVDEELNSVSDEIKKVLINRANKKSNIEVAIFFILLMLSVALSKKVESESLDGLLGFLLIAGPIYMIYKRNTRRRKINE